MAKARAEDVIPRMIAGEMPRRGEMKMVAMLLGICVRTLRRWMALARKGEMPGRRGRPRLSDATREAARSLVREQLELLGYSAGFGTVLKALKVKVAKSLIREFLRTLKAERRKQLREEDAERRKSITVLARDAIWAQDATALESGRPAERREAEVIRDAGSTTFVAASLREGPGDQEDVEAVLEQAIKERGQAPLVLVRDNASVYTSERAVRFLREHQIVHLRTLPHTPKHNAVGERANGELKAELEAAGVTGRVEQEDLDRARARLDRRPRASRGWRNALTLDKEMPEAYSLVPRDIFYQAVCKARQEAVRGPEKPRQRRLALRRADIETMVHFGLIKVTVGGRATMAPEADIIS